MQQTEVQIYMVNKFQQFSVPLAEQIKLSLVECMYLNSVAWEDYQPVSLIGLLAAEQI